MTLDLPILEIKDLKASINNNEILKSLNLTIKRGEIHAIMQGLLLGNCHIQLV